MSWESVIFFLLVLLIWGLSTAARWLKEEIEKGSSRDVESELYEWNASQETESTENDQVSVFPDEGHKEPSPSDERGRMSSPESIVQQLNLRKPQTLRKGIVLMTILGPCRGLERQNDSTLF